MPTIPSGSQNATYSITAAGTYTLNPGETRTQTVGTGIQATVATGYTTIDIEGTLDDTASGARAIRAGVPGGQLIVGANGLVRALNGDALQAQTATGRLDVNNAGQIISASSAGTPAVGGTNPGSAYALNYNAATGAANAPATDFTSGGVITNGSTANTAALIRSDSGDAIRLGSHETLVNYGTINGNGPVNDASTNNVFNSTAPGGNGNPNTSTAQTYDISRGVRINQSGATGDRIDNYGTITGSQHGVDVGVTNATNLVVVNEAGGQIIGRNGSGVGADTTGAAANTVTVDNSGLIRGAYAPLYDRAGYRTVDGDGDGVDIDGGATVINRAGGVIEGAGAGGYDGNGRLNNSEGLSLGGGSVSNSGTIRGAAYGIVVNNDSNPDGSRSGVAATQITNNAGGTIAGQGGYAIRLENKTGTAADNDTITNYGSITGSGGIPAGTVLRQDGTPDPNTVGTLDGRTYTAADAGSARFIQGDGSAVQTGEGGDTLSNYGTITGNSGRAINLEGGNDTLNLYTGSSVVGRIDGGAGTDTLNLRLDDRTGADAALGANSGATTGTLANVVNFETLAVQGGTWTVQDAQAYSAGVTINSGAGLTVGANGSLSGAVANAGTLTFARAGDLTEAGPISGQGAVVQAGTGTLTLATSNTYAGGTTIQSGVLDLAAAGAAGTGAIAFSGAANASQLTLETAAQTVGGTFGNRLDGFTGGNSLDLRGFAYNGQTAYTAANNTLTVTGGAGGNQTQTFSLRNGAATYYASSDGAGGTRLSAVNPNPANPTPTPAPCYVSGTRIRVLRGRTIADVPVERLAVGDLALTASGKPRPIRWIGSRHYPDLTAPAHDRPVRVKAGALADGVPVRDLLVSTDHCLSLDGLFVAAGHLSNGASIVRAEAVRDLTYWHVELDSHDLLLAEATPAESFLAAPGVRAGFDGVGEETDAGTAPVPYAERTERDDPHLDALRARLIVRAGLSTAPTRFGAVRAWLDVCDGARVAGWAVDEAHPGAPVCLDIVLDGEVVALALAQDHRADLAAAGLGDGRCGFDVALDVALAPGVAHTVEVRRSADGLRVAAKAVDAAGAWTALLAA